MQYICARSLFPVAVCCGFCRADEQQNAMTDRQGETVSVYVTRSFIHSSEQCVLSPSSPLYSAAACSQVICQPRSVHRVTFRGIGDTAVKPDGGFTALFLRTLRHLGRFLRCARPDDVYSTLPAPAVGPISSPNCHRLGIEEISPDVSRCRSARRLITCVT